MNAYRLNPLKEAQAAKSLRESLAALNEDDALLIDMVEGETNLFETIDALLARMTLDQALITGIDVLIDDLDGRKARVKKRREADRALIEQALTIAEIESAVERPAGTLSLAKRAPTLVVENEADIPARFWKPAPPMLDKKALTEALRERLKAIQNLPDDPEAKAAALIALPEAVPGATLSNAAPSLTIRIK